jgi:hypothetical protein
MAGQSLAAANDRCGLRWKPGAFLTPSPPGDEKTTVRKAEDSTQDKPGDKAMANGFPE